MPAIAARNDPSNQRRLREIPAPASPIPKIGNQRAFVPPRGMTRLPVVVTRGVVVICIARLWGPLLIFGIGVLVNEHDPPEGSPDPQLRETDCGNPAPVGEILTE
jgi:hypothetical protein